jgi:hypothetical protein
VASHLPREQVAEVVDRLTSALLEKARLIFSAVGAASL